ncbi:protein kinase domain-containing protein [Urbifossiella limnaea]|uniref:Serine/threonine-protein kinase PrkC n=1 Tax=Urbifossiella limnaea TaxID=2528023 RepID=A0A517XXU2_9BACT|nr:protein kinase [Urbifossiella limnaea]QDU22331.1 Serine/threonine-protein kinase PrkC [Urbifossiella limnaea]
MSSRPSRFGPCPTRDALSAYLRGSLPRAAQDGLEAHLSDCEACILRLGDLATPPATGKTPADRPPGWTPFDPPQPDTGSGPRRLGQYRLHEVIGRGGMGKVHRAWHERLKRWVAVKVLPAGRSGDADWVARFDREMEVVGQLDHPNIVRATDAGDAEGVRYLVMELLDGADLARVCKTCHPVPVADACEIIRQAALGLQHAHDHQLVHRDVKPHNLMLAAGGVKVLDLGLALFRTPGPVGGGLTTAGQVMGTPDYMAPEQWDDFRRVDARADLYALGCTLYHLLTGKPPFDRCGTPTTPGGLAAERPEVPAEVVSLCDRMTARDPAMRPATATEVAVALAPLAAGADLPALLARVPVEVAVTSDWAFLPPVPASTRTPVPAPRRSRRMWVGVTTAALAVVAVTAVVFARGNGDATPPVPPPAPDTPSKEAPIPDAARAPEKGEWVRLLKKAPEPRLWKGGFGTHVFHDPAAEALSIQTISRALIPLGHMAECGYHIQVSVRQTRWTGYVGVYFGGRTGADGRFTFQVIELRPFQPQAGQPFVVSRETGEIQPGGQLAHSSTHLFASTILPHPPGNQEQMVELMVDRRKLQWVRWDGVPCHELTGTTENNRFQPADYVGEFGIYVSTGATLVRSARYMSRP